MPGWLALGLPCCVRPDWRSMGIGAVVYPGCSPASCEDARSSPCMPDLHYFVTINLYAGSQFHETNAHQSATSAYLGCFFWRKFVVLLVVWRILGNSFSRMEKSHGVLITQP